MKTMIFGLMLASLALTRESAAGELMLYGGKKLDVFLGCMDCSDRDENSIWSKEGEYGSASFKEASIWYNFGNYGGVFSDLSPFSRWAKHPPAVFDSRGKFLGYMTVNPDQPKRTRVKLARMLLAFHETIKRDMPAFYDIYFESEEPGETGRFSRRGGGYSRWK